MYQRNEHRRILMVLQVEKFCVHSGENQVEIQWSKSVSLEKWEGQEIWIQEQLQLL